MFKITKDGATVAMTEAPNYIKQAENGCFVLCPEAEATGIAHNGTVYHLLGRPDMAGQKSRSCWKKRTRERRSPRRQTLRGSCSSQWRRPEAWTPQRRRNTRTFSRRGRCRWPIPWARSADIRTGSCINAFRPIRHKRTGRRTKPQAFGRRFPIRRRNGRNGPSRLAHMTHTARTPRCRTMASIGPALWTATCGSLACTGGRRCKPWALPTS